MRSWARTHKNVSVLDNRHIPLSAPLTTRCSVQSKIQELSDQVTEVTTKNGSIISQMQELQREKATLEEALAGQAAQLQRLTSEYMLMRARSVSNMFLPSSTLQFDPSEDVILKYPASTSDGCAEHVLLPSSDIQQCASSLLPGSSGAEK